MIRIGILSGDHSDTRSIKLIRQFKEFKVTGTVSYINKPDGISPEYSTEDLLDNSDAIYINICNPSFGLIEMAIKNSNHLFLKQIPTVPLAEIKQLANLQNEAGTVIHFFNPYVFLTENLKIPEQLK